VPSSLTWPRSHFFDGIEPPVANAGDLHISLRDRVDQNIVSMTVGSFGYDRFLSLGSTKLGDGWLLYAGEFNTYDGLWVTAEDVRKFSGLLRYSQGTPTNGFSATAMAYTSNWNSPAGFPQAQIGNAPGNFIPEAPWMVASAGITFGEKTGWFSALGWRYISSRPLTEDGVFQSPPLNTINANVGYRFANGWRVQLDALNLLNSTSYNASYAYGALLTSDSLFAMCFPTPKIPVAVCQNGFMDYSVHPLEPLAVRLTLAGPLDAIDLPGMATELRRAVPAFTPPSANYDWSGLYIGGFGEVSWSQTSGSAI
jgi:hypothetical protein